ncbi:hypothetical protein ES703_92418 [subsurface metagenome]
MAGTARALEQKELKPDDIANFNRDFDLLTTDLSKLVDPELGRDLADEKEFYLAVCQVAKGYFNDKPFGGLKAATGQYGMRFIIPQDFRTQSGGGSTYQLYSWFQTKSTGAATTVFDLFGSSGSPILAETEAENKNVIAFHRLLSYKPDPQLMMLQFTINDFPYAPYSVEPFSKITKADKLFKIIPMMGRVVLHPGGKLYVKAWIDRMHSGTTTPSTAYTLDIEIAPFGLLFAEQAYLNIDDAIV